MREVLVERRGTVLHFCGPQQGDKKPRADPPSPTISSSRTHTPAPARHEPRRERVRAGTLRPCRHCGVQVRWLPVPGTPAMGMYAASGEERHSCSPQALQMMLAVCGDCGAEIRIVSDAGQSRRLQVTSSRPHVCRGPYNVSVVTRTPSVAPQLVDPSEEVAARGAFPHRWEERNSCEQCGGYAPPGSMSCVHCS
jgi:hypothetical protein